MAESDHYSGGWRLVKIYSVMKSGGNSFGEDFVLNFFNMSYVNEDSILDQKYGEKRYIDLY